MAKMSCGEIKIMTGDRFPARFHFETAGGISAPFSFAAGSMESKGLWKRWGGVKEMKRLLAVILAAAILASGITLPEGALAAQKAVTSGENSLGLTVWSVEDDHWTMTMRVGNPNAIVNLYDSQNRLLKSEDDAVYSGASILETEGKSLAVVKLDQDWLAILDENSRAGITKTEEKSVTITLSNGTVYFRVGQSTGTAEKLEVIMDDVRLSCGAFTSGIAQKTSSRYAVTLVRGQASITAGNGTESSIGAGEMAFMETGAYRKSSFEKKLPMEEDLPDFLVKAMRLETHILEDGDLSLLSVFEENGWEKGRLFGAIDLGELAELEKKYWVTGLWLSRSEGRIHLYDSDDNDLEVEEGMRFFGGTALETEEESQAAVDMDRERLAIMDEISRAEFEKTANGDQISIALKSGSMYFRVGEPLEGDESFDVLMDDIRLAIRGTCGMVQREEEDLSIILASGHAEISREGEEAGKTEGITIGAGEIVTVETVEGAEPSFNKRELQEDEIPAFLMTALSQEKTEQVRRVREETDWKLKTIGGYPISLDQLDETVRSYYQAMIDKKEQVDYFGVWGNDTAVGYQYALVYIDEEDSIPALLLAGISSFDGCRYFKVFQYDPEKPGLWQCLEPWNEYKQRFYLRKGGKGLLYWNNDGMFHDVIYEARRGQYDLEIIKLWDGPDNTWPDEIPKEDITWIDIP